MKASNSRPESASSVGSVTSSPTLPVDPARASAALAVKELDDNEERRKASMKAAAEATRVNHRLMKYVSFGLLVCQNSALTCTMRWSRAHTSGPLYATSTAVVMSELAKIAVSFLLLLVECGSLAKFKESLQVELFGKPEESLKLLVPGLLYTLQNNLQYVASANLQPAVFQVMYQVKMLTTAILSVTMLKKKLRPHQWGGVGLLTLGLVLVQLSQSQAGAGSAGGNALVGFSAVLSACTLAGFAGCYLERVLKGSTTSLWIRNLQLSAWGSLLGAVSVVLKDGRQVATQGFFHGYTSVVWGVVGIQAAGGLLISLVVRYGDALLKGFATGLAIILTTLVSVVFFGFQVSPAYAAGASTTFLAVLLYSGLIPKLARKLGVRLPGCGALHGEDAHAPPASSKPLPGYPWSRVALGGAVRGALALGFLAPSTSR